MFAVEVIHSVHPSLCTNFSKCWGGGGGVYKKMFFSVRAKNLNWDILTKYLVTFKRWNRIKNEKF